MSPDVSRSSLPDKLEPGWVEGYCGSSSADICFWLGGAHAQFTWKLILPRLCRTRCRPQFHPSRYSVQDTFIIHDVHYKLYMLYTAEVYIVFTSAKKWLVKSVNRSKCRQ